MANSQRGAALILALLILSFLTILGSALLTTTTIDVWIGDNYRTGTQSLYLAEAGIDSARETMRASGSAPSSMLTTAAGVDGALAVSTDLATLLASDDNPVIPANAGLRATGEVLTDAGGRTVGNYWVWVRNDVTEAENSTTDSNDVLNLISFARIGNATKVLDVTVKKGRFPRLPAALTLDGPVATFDAANSNIFEIDGNDSGAAGEDENAIGVITGGDDTTVSNAIPANRQANYTGVDGGVPDVENIDGEMDPMLKTVAGLESIVNSIASSAHDIYNPAFGSATTINNYGAAAAYRVGVVNGDCNLGPGTGYGIMVCRGNLTVSGNFNWFGMILVIGQGVIHWNGGGNGSIDGGLFIARTRANDRSGANTLGTLLANRGSITADFNGGGGSGIHYNTTTIAMANQQFPFNPIAYREQ